MIIEDLQDAPRRLPSHGIKTVCDSTLFSLSYCLQKLKTMGQMKYLFSFIFLISTGLSLHAGEPILVIPADNGGWILPIYSPDDKVIVFTNASRDEIWVTERDQLAPRMLTSGTGLANRLTFEPDQNRIVFRRRVNALPNRPVRLFSTSYYLYDPVVRMANSGDILGPYLVDNKVCYRRSLTDPLIDCDGKTRYAGPYLDPASGKLWVVNSNRDTIYTSSVNIRFGAVELSPDGKWVAAVTTEPTAAIWIMEIETGQATEVSAGSWPSWSANSQNLTFLTKDRESDPPEIHILRLSTMKTEKVYRSESMLPETPALNRDGSRVLFVSEGSIYEIDLKH